MAAGSKSRGRSRHRRAPVERVPVGVTSHLRQHRNQSEPPQPPPSSKKSKSKGRSRSKKKERKKVKKEIEEIPDEPAGTGEVEEEEVEGAMQSVTRMVAGLFARKVEGDVKEEGAVEVDSAIKQAEREKKRKEREKKQAAREKEFKLAYELSRLQAKREKERKKKKKLKKEEEAKKAAADAIAAEKEAIRNQSWFHTIKGAFGSGNATAAAATEDSIDDESTNASKTAGEDSDEEEEEGEGNGEDEEETTGGNLWAKLRGLVGLKDEGAEEAAHENDEEGGEEEEEEEVVEDIKKKYQRRKRRESSFVNRRIKKFESDSEAHSSPEEMEDRKNQILQQSIAWMQQRVSDGVAQLSTQPKKIARRKALQAFLGEHDLEAFTVLLQANNVDSIKEARKLTKADFEKMGVAHKDSRKELVKAFKSCPRVMMLEAWNCLLCGERDQPILTTKCTRCSRPAPSREGILKRQSAMKIQGAWRSYCARSQFKGLLKRMKKDARRMKREKEAKRDAKKAMEFADMIKRSRSRAKRMSYTNLKSFRKGGGARGKAKK